MTPGVIFVGRSKKSHPVSCSLNQKLFVIDVEFAVGRLNNPDRHGVAGNVGDGKFEDNRKP